jgi:TM2 domain-containing membrane protein YozV
MKSKTTATLLAFFLGGFGFHQFYLGNTKSGIFYLIFFWTLIPSFFALYDFFLFLFMSKDTFNMRYNYAI